MNQSRWPEWTSPRAVGCGLLLLSAICYLLPEWGRPKVQEVWPADGSGGVALLARAAIRFGQSMDPDSFTGRTLSLTGPHGGTVPISFRYDQTTKTAEVIPGGKLERGVRYTVGVRGGLGGVVDQDGKPLAESFKSTFSTVTYGAGSGGPGGPILVLTDPRSPTSSYYPEILLAEGLNEFSVQELESISGEVLGRFELVILGAIPVNADQTAILTEWVNGGGHLIAMQPVPQLSQLFGLRETGHTLTEGYLRFESGPGPGGGLVSTPLQYHGSATCYTIEDAKALAFLYVDPENSTVHPAVTLREVGVMGGQAAAFTFDLARSIIETRQGNPRWAGQDRDGIAPVRSNDLFYGAARFDPQPDWLDLENVAIPQADEQQRFLANLLIVMNADRCPLPRFWYFPRDHRALVVMTGDDHGMGGTTKRFAQYQKLSLPNASIEEWQAIRGTSYVFVNRHLSNSQAANLSAEGFEIGLHLDTGCVDYSAEGLQKIFSDQLQQFKRRYPSLAAPTTHRTHCIAWSGYTVLPEVEFQHGIRLDTTYYYWPGSWVANRPGMFTGSGMPMRFATAEGRVIDVYQAATQMTDESGQLYPQTIDALLDRALGSEGFYGAFVANMHTDEGVSAGSDAILASAKQRGVPVISARQLLEWTDARNSSAFRSIRSEWNAEEGIRWLEFAIEAHEMAKGLEAMVPIPAGIQSAEAMRGQLKTDFRQQRIKGIDYITFPALPGLYRVRFNAKRADRDHVDSAGLTHQETGLEFPGSENSLSKNQEQAQ